MPRSFLPGDCYGFQIGFLVTGSQIERLSACRFIPPVWSPSSPSVQHHSVGGPAGQEDPTAGRGLSAGGVRTH